MKQTAFKCKICSYYIVGIYHEMVTCSCKKCFIDVGSLNYSVLGDFQFIKDNWLDYCLEKNSSIEEIKEKLLWGNYGINDKGESLLDVWYSKELPKVKQYHSNQFIWMSQTLKEFLTKKEYNDYIKWEKSKPIRTHKLMKDMDSDHIFNIIKTQNISNNIKDAFKLELKNRGIDSDNL